MIDEKKLIEDFKNTFSDSVLNQTFGFGKYTFLEAIEEMIERQPKTDWIPCEERLPSESGYYFACIYDEDVDDFDFRKIWFAHVDDYDMEESEWRERYGFETVTAWQPLPSPYKKEGAE